MNEQHQFWANNIHWLNKAEEALSNLMVDDERELTGISREMRTEGVKQIRAALDYIGKLAEKTDG